MVFAVFFQLVTLALVAGLFVKLSRLEDAVGKLDNRPRGPERGIGAPNRTPPSVPQPVVPIAKEDPAQPTAPAMETPPPVPTVGTAPVSSQRVPVSRQTAPAMPGLERQIGQRLLLLGGLIILVIGVAYFLRYSIEQGWIPPAVRILMTYLAGAGLLAIGELARRKDLRAFGLSLVGAGCCTLYFASFAGFELYGLLPNYLAFGLAAVTTALACTLALIYDGKWLAVLGLAGGMLSPALFASDDPHYMVHFTYLALLNAGVLGIAFRRQWGLLNHLGLWFTWGNVLGWLIAVGHPPPVWGPLLFQGLFFLIYAGVPFAYFLTREGAPQPLRGFLMIVPNALISLGVAAGILEPYGSPWVALVALVYAGVFLALATWLRGLRPSAQSSQSGFLVQAAFFIAVAAPLAMDGPWVAFSWALLAIAVLRLSAGVQHRLPLVAAVFLLAAGWIHLFAYDYPFSFGQHRFLSGFEGGYLATFALRWLVLSALIAATVYAVVTFGSHAALREGEQRVSRRLLSAILIALIFFVGMREIAGLFRWHFPAAFDAALSVYGALFALMLIGAGFVRRVSPLRITGLALFAGIGLKVFLVDMAEASTPFRILSFIGVGSFLILGSFIYHRFRDVSEREESVAEPLF